MLPAAQPVVILTGASGALGTGLARGLSAAGMRLALSARRAHEIEALAEELGNDVIAVRGDVTVQGDRERLVETAVERFGRLDGLINNAAISQVAPALQEDLDAFQAALETNLTAPFALSVLACRQMRECGGGSIVNIASSMALRSIDRIPHAAYVASKAGLLGLTRELASQWGRYQVRVNAVAPGFFMSDMNRDLHAGDGEMAPWLRERVPLSRGGRIEELVATVEYLLRPAGGYVSGQVIPLDGGLTTR